MIEITEVDHGPQRRKRGGDVAPTAANMGNDHVRPVPECGIPNKCEEDKSEQFVG